MSGLLTVREVAQALGVSAYTVYSLIRRGLLPGTTRLGRRVFVKRAPFERWLVASGPDQGHGQPARGGETVWP